jgi:hypothetical protein
VCLQFGQARRIETGEFAAHHRPATASAGPPACAAECTPAPIQHRRDQRARGHGLIEIEAEGASKLRNGDRRNFAAEQRAAGLVDDAEHLDMVVGQGIPDRQEQSGREVHDFRGCGGDRFGDLAQAASNVALEVSR